MARGLVVPDGLRQRFNRTAQAIDRIRRRFGRDVQPMLHPAPIPRREIEQEAMLVAEVAIHTGFGRIDALRELPGRDLVEADLGEHENSMFDDALTEIR